MANFCMDFTPLDNGRFSYLANMISKDNKVEIVTSDFYHITKQYREKKAFHLPYKVTLIHEPAYPKNICFKRFYSHYIWGRNVLKYIKSRKKPDVIYCAVPSLTGPNLIAKYCEQNGIRLIIDIQDLWPEAFRMIFNIPIISKILFSPFYILANGIYKRADAICAVSDTYCHRAMQKNKKCITSTTVYLGTELSAFDKYAKENPILIKNNNEIWLGYCGTLGSSYDLISVMDALVILKPYKIKFIIMGDGPRKTEFENYAISKGINTIFTGRLKYDSMCSLLCACDIAVNPITHMAAQSIINKHADYAASGIPVISTQENDEYRNLIEEYKMGFNCRNMDSADLARKIQILLDDRDLRIKMGNNARKCAEERFDRATTYKLLEKQLVVGKAVAKFRGDGL